MSIEDVRNFLKNDRDIVEIIDKNIIFDGFHVYEAIRDPEKYKNKDVGLPLFLLERDGGVKRPAGSEVFQIARMIYSQGNP